MNSRRLILKCLGQIPKILDQSAIFEINNFLLSKLGKTGYFVNRFGDEDLYYSSFALASASATNLNLKIDKIDQRLQQENVANLDLIHLACYIRSRSIIQKMKGQLLQLLRPLPEVKLINNCDKTATPYDLFLTVTAKENGRIKLKNRNHYLEQLQPFAVASVGWSNLPNAATATLNATAAAMVVTACCRGKVNVKTIEWLWLQFDKNSGGFYAVSGAPLPDLLSTSSALLALYACGEKISSETKQKCQEFIFDHWCEDGGFSGTVADDLSDCEYTFYALLALGVLALC